jgi:type VI secretion system secreted protein Hcp
MAFDAFLKIEGIQGDSTYKSQEGAITVTSFSWGETNSGSIRMAGGGGAGKVSVQDFHFKSPSSKASPNLMIACASGKHFNQGVLTVYQNSTDRAPTAYLKLTLSEVLISSYSLGGDQASTDPIPQDEFSLNFSKIEFSYTAQTLDGSLGSPVTATWDVTSLKIG